MGVEMRGGVRDDARRARLQYVASYAAPRVGQPVRLFKVRDDSGHEKFFVEEASALRWRDQLVASRIGALAYSVQIKLSADGLVTFLNAPGSAREVLIRRKL